MNVKTIFFGFIFLNLLFGSCVNEEKVEDKRIFNYNEPSGISSLDPAFARDQANIWAVNQLFNGLVQFDDSLKINPCIATSWEIADNSTTYIFHLRNDVFFHDNSLFENGKGRRVTASDFVFSFKRLAGSELASPGAWVLKNLRDDASALLAKDDSTFIVKLKKPFAPFLGLMAMQYCSVVPKEIVEHYGKEFRVHPVGTGPFQFSLWKDGLKLILVKNKNYFEIENGEQLPFLDAIAISFIPNRESAFMEFLQGKYDFLSGIDGAYKERLLTKSGTLQPVYEKKFVLMISPYLNTEYLGILMEKNTLNPLQNKLIRKAIAYGFSRKKMIAYLRNNIGISANSGFVPSGLPSYDADKVQGYTYNPEKAKHLLIQAGFPGGKGLPEISLGVTPGYVDYCEYIQSMLAESGIKVKLETNQGAVHRELVAKSKLKFFRGSWIADYPDAENFLSLFYSKNFSPDGPNYTHFKNQEFDLLYEKAVAETDDSRRFELYQKMDNILMEEVPVVVLYYDQAVRLIHNNIEGLGINAMNLLTLKRVRKN